MIVDAHTHLGLSRFLARPIPPEKLSRPAFQDPMENSMAHLIARMDANAVRRAVAFPYPLQEIDRVQANSYVLEAHQTYPDRIIPFALVDDDPARWLLAGARGFKQHDILDSVAPFDIGRAYQVMAEAGVPLIVHFRAAPGYSVPEQVKAILQQAPGLKLIVAHMGRHTPNTSHRVEEALLGLQDEPTIIFETSTVRDPAIVARAVELVGAERVCFGSDFPFNSFQDSDPLALEIDVIEQAGLNDADRAAVLGGSLLAWLGEEAVRS